MTEKEGLTLDRFMDGLIRRNPGEVEFHQAVKELAHSVIPLINENPNYLHAKILERMTEPDRTIIFRVCWEDDKGVVHVNRGYRIQFNNAIGPYKGGLRFHPSVNLSILKFLGFEQVFKNSLTGLPMGAGKGGANFNPRGRSDREVMRFCQAYMNELSKHIGENIDVPAGDIGVGTREISFMFGQYKRLKNEFTGVLTGKSLEYGGSLVRQEATGYGCTLFMEEMLNHVGDSIKGKKCLVSGAGNVAQFAVQKIVQLGGKVLTLSDSSGFIYDPDGINQEKLEYVKELKNVKRGRIKEYAEKYNCEYHEGKKPWSVACDLAFPCATQNEIHLKDAELLIKNKIKALCEGANMPTMEDAVHLLQKEGVLYAPGKASNAGGVAVSGLEMSQNSIRMSWSEEELERRLKEIMQNIHRLCILHGTQKNSQVNYLYGANLAGFKKVADAMLAYGVV